MIAKSQKLSQMKNVQHWCIETIPLTKNMLAEELNLADEAVFFA